MDASRQSAKAERLRSLHHQSRLLILPNVWDPLGARLLESLGYPAVATASAAVAFSLGLDDGERLGFDTMLEVIRRIAGCVEVPMTADIERGYADSVQQLYDNARQVVGAGAVGVNLEDSTAEGGSLRPAAEQAERISAVRQAARADGVDVFINARIDTFLQRGRRDHSDRLEETIERAKAYIDAGAECIYPIGLGDLVSLRRLRKETKAPINVYASPGAAAMRELEEADVSRISIGPGLLKASLTAMKRVAEGLLRYEPYDALAADMISSDDIRSML